MMILWLPFQNVSPLFPLVILLFFLELQALCWMCIERMEFFILFLIIVEFFLVSLYLIWCCNLMAIYFFDYIYIFPCIPDFLKIFILKGCWTSSKALSAFNKMIMWCFSFILFTWWITLIDFPVLNHSCISGMKTTWSR